LTSTRPDAASRSAHVENPPAAPIDARAARARGTGDTRSDDVKYVLLIYDARAARLA
jgi:hypothetical protein